MIKRSPSKRVRKRREKRKWNKRLRLQLRRARKRYPNQHLLKMMDGSPFLLPIRRTKRNDCLI